MPGAITEGGVVVLEEQALAESDVSGKSSRLSLLKSGSAWLVIRLGSRWPAAPERAGKVVIIVDDGLATGATRLTAWASRPCVAKALGG